MPGLGECASLCLFRCWEDGRRDGKIAVMLTDESPCIYFSEIASPLRSPQRGGGPAPVAITGSDELFYPELRAFGGKSNRSDSSLSRAGGTSAGAPIIRSSPC